MSQRDVRVARVVAHPARIISANILCLRSRCWLLDTRDDAVPLDNSADFRGSLLVAVGAGCAVSACAKALGTQAGRLHRDARPPALAGAALCGVHRISSIVEVSERACAGHEARNDLMRAALHGAVKKRRAGGRHSPLRACGQTASPLRLTGSGGVPMTDHGVRSCGRRNRVIRGAATLRDLTYLVAGSGRALGVTKRIEPRWKVGRCGEHGPAQVDQTGEGRE